MENEVPNQNPAENVQNKVQCCNKEHVPGEESAPMKEKSQHSETDVKSCGDCKKETEKEDKSAAIEETTSATALSSQRADCSDTIQDRDSSEKEVRPVAEAQSPDKDSKPMEKKSNPRREKHKSTTQHTQQLDDRSNVVENIGSATPQASQTEDPQVTTASEERLEEPESTTQHTQQLDDRSNDVENNCPTTPEASQTEDPQVTSDTSQTKTQEASETTVSPTQAVVKNDGDCKEETQKKEESAAIEETTSASEERWDTPESATQDTPQLDDHSNDVENIGPTTPEASQTEDPQVTSGSGKFWIAAAIVIAIFAIGLQHFRQPESPPQTNDVRHIDVFLRQLEKVKTRFPNQRAELWNRGRIHLKRHLQTTQPTEPVSLILTAGLRAEKTLSCLARDLASAYSSARNASVLHIDGASKASQDSDQVKLDIDRKLQGAFEGDKPVAVIHRFEELPPGSTLVFYRYCDHKNAPYKNTLLIFTVLLGEEDEIPAKISLCAVEELVDDHLQKKFLTHGHPVSFDSTVHHIFPGPYLDKYGGLWSRISHLILPVAAEERIELEGC